MKLERIGEGIWSRVSRLAGLTCALVAGALLVPAMARASEQLDGFWKDSDGEVILEVGPCKGVAGARCARVAWLRLPNGPDGKALTDYRNPDPTLRNRPVCGLEVVSGFKKQSDGTWGDGTVYVSDLGSSFSGYATVLGPSKVEVRGYVLLPLFGQSEVWSRVTKPFEHCVTKSATVPGLQAAKPADAAASKSASQK